MTLIEFIKHPAYNYYITTLVHDCLLSDLTNVFDYNLLKYIKKPNFATNTIDYIISANIDIADEVEEQIQQLLQFNNYCNTIIIKIFIIFVIITNLISILKLILMIKLLWNIKILLILK